ncbi:outer membrane protein assembly factor YaeT precursor [Blastochloris viridis]|uniref:Outer membrane protein assembly factor BamA n=1 Tax=Blastochloris viridis TaxID=1079 RepID=A0A182D541_BLAVI|nr:outer membrane protein assembly factor YaeT precursor [Blastochloris viridis]
MVVLSTPALAQSASAIVVQGNRRVDADTIRGYFRGNRLDAATIDEGVKSLFATGLFEDVRVSQQGGRLVVTVVENLVINRVAFEGNKKIKDDVLTGEVQSKSRGPLSRATVQSDVQRILEVYRRSGRYDIRVDPKIIDLPNGRVDLVFEVTEGSKTAVRRIEFVGNHAFGDWKLKDVMTTTESNWLSWLKNSDVYDPDRLNADQELIRRFYLKNGYADFRILSATADLDREKNEFVIVIAVDEGEQYKFGAVEVQSNIRDIDSASLRRVLRTQTGATYNADSVEKTIEDLTIEVSKKGYAFAQVRPRGDRDPETKQIAVTYVIEEGPRVYIERINVRGNTRTRDYVVRREFDIYEGDAYNRVMVDKAERRLKNLGYFKTVKIANEPGSAPDRVILNVDVEDQPTGEFSVAGGYSTAEGFIGEVSVAERNFLGRGHYVRVAGSWGEYSKGAEFNFTDPYFLGHRIAAGFDLFYKETSPSSSNSVSYTNNMKGGTIRFGLPLQDDLSIQLRYSLYQQEITIANEAYSDGDPDNGEASQAFKEIAGDPQLVSLVGYTLAYNTLDSNKTPTKGVYAELRQDFAGVGGDVNFIRTTGDVKWYHDLGSDIVGLLRAQGGHVTGWGDQDFRIMDGFFMGPNLVRGFKSAGIGPRDLASYNQDALGGTMYWGTSAEVQFPVPWMPKDFGLKGALFADAGSVWDYQGEVYSGMDVRDENVIRSSVGAGVIWTSPFGPIRIDYAVALSKDTYDKTQAFRFSGGTRF